MYPLQTNVYTHICQKHMLSSDTPVKHTIEIPGEGRKW